MSPDSRREQLLELGVRLFATRSLEDLSIETLAEEAGISRGLLYHYFGNKQEFHTAVVRRAADDLFAVTAPTATAARWSSWRGPWRATSTTWSENYRATSRWCAGRPVATRVCARSTRSRARR